MTDRPLNREALIAALDWYRAAGVDLAVGEVPLDRFALSRPPALARSATASGSPDAPVPAQPTVPNPASGGIDADPLEAREAAAAAGTLEELREALAAFEGCGLKQRATNLVFADGNPRAPIMLVGEAPGREEDLQGKPFVGRSGQLLDRMLAAIGLDRSGVYIANTLPWRPPGNRTPAPSEVAVCLPFLHRQIELVAPRVLIALGGAAASHLFETQTGITKIRGQWRELTVGTHSAKAMATLHPAYLLRQPAAKALVWRDLLAIRAALDAL